MTTGPLSSPSEYPGAPNHDNSPPNTDLTADNLIRDLTAGDPIASTPPKDLIAAVDAVRHQRAKDAEGEVVSAGFQPRPAAATSISGSGFESGGILDTSEPSASLAGLTDAATRDDRLAELADDELIGVIRAWRRIESWSCGGLLMAIAELARRRPAERTPSAPPGAFPAQLSEFTGDEVAAALTLSNRMADAYLALALDLATRLPDTAQALRTGVIDHLKARLIAEATRILTDADAHAVEARVLPAAGRQTLSRLRAAVSRAVLTVDPEAATRRREEAQKDPRVRRWQEDAGTAALAGFGLPPADVLEADQRITTRALALRDAGLPGSLEELRARAYLDTLLGQHSTPRPDPPPSQDPASGHDSALSQDPASGQAPAAGQAPASGESPDPAPRSQPNDPHPSPADPGHGSGSGEPSRQSRPGHPSPGNPGGPVPPAGAPAERQRSGQGRVAARLNVTVTLTTLLGLSKEPGAVAGFGPIDPELARDLATLAASHPASRYCITVTDDHGHPLGHGCARGQPPSFAQPGNARSSPGQPPPPRRRPGPFTVTINPLARDNCDHQHQEPGYKPSRRLQHLIGSRTTTCSAPGCHRPAAQCDLDHTFPYGQGGRTCECNLAPLCRHHHRCKQSDGWRLEQPQPGVMIWTTPAGRHYITKPDAYP